MEQETFIASFPHWLSITHFINFLFITLLVRSGIQILSDHPRLYMNDNCTPNSEWIKFTKAKVPLDKYYTSGDDEVPVSPVIALPGGKHSLGIARNWHFFSIFFWVLNGLIYVTLLFATGQWRRLIPTSWDIFPRAWDSFLTYATFHLPPASNFHPYDPLQQLSYAFVVFILAPLMILTGAAMSPAVAGRFPWYTNLFGGRQAARSIHFIGMIAFILFFIIHVSLVAIINFPQSMDRIVLGLENEYQGLAIVIGLLAIAFVIWVNIKLTRWSNEKPRSVQKSIGSFAEWLMKLCLYKLKSKQKYTRADLSPYFWINGYPPTTPDWLSYKENGFKDYKLEIKGLIEKPLLLSIEDLRTMREESQITKHCCIQGWTGIGEWGGVPVSEVLKLAKPLPNAKYVIFHSYQLGPTGHEYYSSLEMEEANYPQVILAYEFNYEPLSIAHGAPLRLRIESKLGFKMTKWLKSIEIVQDLREVGLGYGGYREDYEYFTPGAQI
jgi:methionine sulfoxide reductase catalytic subunit